MEVVDGGRVVREEKSFPDDLEERLAVVANAVNTELKSVTLLHLDDVPREGKEIKARVRESVGRGYLPLAANIFGEYCNTLNDIALVAKESVVRDDGEIQHIAYSLTEAGKRYGQPIAELALRWAVDNNLSIFQVLGSTLTPSKKSRAPYNRIKILESLQEGRLREVDLVNIVNLSYNSVLSHFISLQKIGFVKFDSTGAKIKDKFNYQWNSDKALEILEPVSGRKGLVRKVAKYMFGHQDKEFSSRELGEVLKYKSLEDISTVLNVLEKRGLIRRGEWKRGEIESKVYLLESGRRFLDEFVFPTREFLLELRGAGASVSGEEQRRGIDLYREVSPTINKKSLDKRVLQLKNYLRQHSNSTSREISQAFELSMPRVLYIIRLVRDNLIVKKEEKEVRYAWKEKS